MSEVYQLLRPLLRYPRAGWIGELARCRATLRPIHPQATLLVDAFAERVENLNLEQLQELYTATFDLNPVCTLEVGWQLFGEEYARGSFLVAMRDHLREHGISEEGELPDHLTNVLPLLDYLEQDIAAEFAHNFVVPAVKKMLKEIGGKDNPYENVMRAVELLLPAPVEVPAHD